MYTLNLVNPEKSNIKYKITGFSDSQNNIVLENDKWNQPGNPTICIISRMSWADLQIIICAVQALRNSGITTIKLYVPYFLGARSDRQFEFGSTHYLKDVICPIINSLNLNSVTVMDPHSDVLEACLDNFHKENNFRLVKFALTDIDNRNDARERITLVSPDAGAFKKIFDVAQYFEITNIITATKVRDLKTGHIKHTEVTVNDSNPEMKYVIIDDICDGGRTFIELAKAIKVQKPSAKIYLVITHGIFSAGLFDLSAYCERVYCTNSVKDIQADESSDYTVSKEFLKQLNII
jgi:ribose-phosphate pyrophosphokinase